MLRWFAEELRFGEALLLIVDQLFSLRMSDLCLVHFTFGQDLGQSLQFRECFDVAVARAVAEMRVLGFY